MNIVRTIVSGKKNRLIESGYNLDLTYVVPRIIAMSFPASGLEKSYRNSLKDVQSFLNERHGKNVLIINLSGRFYDFSKFSNNVVCFQWEDHHAPTLSTLFKVCSLIDHYLKNDQQNVVAVHCLAGKGRTGTAICCYLIYSGRFQTADEALAYYAKKRFSKGGGVTQPSQVRYVQYFYEIFKHWKRTPVIKYIRSVEVYNVPRMSHSSCRPYIEIFSMRANSLMYTDKKVNRKEQTKYKADLKKNNEVPIMINVTCDVILSGDILIKIIHNGKYKMQKVCSFSINTCFIPGKDYMRFQIHELDPDKIKSVDNYNQSFSIGVNFDSFCSCDSFISFNQKCEKCRGMLENEVKDWEDIYQQMNVYFNQLLSAYNKQDYQANDVLSAQKLLFGDPYFDDYYEILYAGIMAPIEIAYSEEDDKEDKEEKEEGKEINSPISLISQ